jgi:hypothetical protein
MSDTPSSWLVNLARSFRAVAWSFIGIRKSSEHGKDMHLIKPVQVIIVGLVLAILFVIGLVTVINLVVSV